MVVITGIKTVIKIAPIIYKVAKIGYKGFSKTRAGSQWIRRHPRVIKYGTAGAGIGSLLLDLTNIDYSAIIPPAKYRKDRQTRTNFYRASNRRFYDQKCQPIPRRSRRR